MENDVVHNGFAAALVMLLFAGAAPAKAADAPQPPVAARVAQLAATPPALPAPPATRR